MRVRGKNLVVTKEVTFQLTSSGRAYQLLLKPLEEEVTVLSEIY